MTTMQAIHISTPGDANVLQITTRDIPTPGEGQVLIKVYAAGLNRLDILQRRGAYPPPPGASDLPGLDVAGEIVALGANATEIAGFRVGDKVCALLSGGGYAQYAVATASHCLPVPTGWSYVEAASLPETYFTVWSNVFQRAHLSSGETLLIQGGSSGIGITAIQLAKAFGHRVFVTAGSAEKCRECEAFGADRAINYREEDFVSIVKEATNGAGVDVILDMVGGDYIPREIDAGQRRSHCHDWPSTWRERAGGLGPNPPPPPRHHWLDFASARSAIQGDNRCRAQGARLASP
ncbi:hypothetical protein LEN26_012221 [Aphanomyces euteiches]|nr:hypothetical protein LEN26_012221 [Aphanomyces euteiches]